MARSVQQPPPEVDLSGTLVERRNYDPSAERPQHERRQFTNSHEELSPEARELAASIDAYKLHHRRRFITHEEMMGVVKSIGYRK